MLIKVILGLKMNNTDDEELDEEIANTSLKSFKRKKFLIYIIPIVVIIGLAVSFITVSSRQDRKLSDAEFSIVTSTDDNQNEATTVFYSLPELSARLRSSTNNSFTVKAKINIELSSVDDIKTIEAMLPRINDILLAHVVELTPNEISGANGLYLLKQELLYRINLVIAPIKISNLSFKSFDIQENN